MNVKEVMSREVKTMRMVDRLDAAARILWEQDCGIVPVVDGNQAVVGVVTDRDLCMASYTQGRSLGEIAVTAVMARTVRTCKPDDALTVAMVSMQQHQLHRLPVVDARGVVVGMLSITDLVRLANARPAALDAAAVLKALATINASRRSAVSPSSPTSAVSAPNTATAPAKVAAPVEVVAAVPAASPVRPAVVAVAPPTQSMKANYNKSKPAAKSKGKKG